MSLPSVDSTSTVLTSIQAYKNDALTALAQIKNSSLSLEEKEKIDIISEIIMASIPVADDMQGQMDQDRSEKKELKGRVEAEFRFAKEINLVKDGKLEMATTLSLNLTEKQEKLKTL